LTDPPVVHEDGTVVSTEPEPSLIVLRMEWPGGAYREYTVRQPLEFTFAVAPSGGNGRSEPKIALMFAGNPQAGGVQVRQEGAVLAPVRWWRQLVGEDDARVVPVVPVGDLADHHPVALHRELDRAHPRAFPAVQPTAGLAGTGVDLPALGAGVSGGWLELGVQVADLVRAEVFHARLRRAAGQLSAGLAQIRPRVAELAAQAGEFGRIVSQWWSPPLQGCS
jgi:hypothetical protein